MKRSGRYYSDEEVDEILRICRMACKNALKQVALGLKEGTRFEEAAGRFRTLYGGAVAGIVFEFRPAPTKAELVDPPQITDGNQTARKR